MTLCPDAGSFTAACPRSGWCEKVWSRENPRCGRNENNNGALVAGAMLESIGHSDRPEVRPGVMPAAASIVG